ncbi:hypothetical protein VSR17_04935 [Cupriavidus taiwanensis]|uniref:Transmembrane lipoprotein n=1 Tax=Cupriavidus taiwanensis TaxID=164546 RepID=A0A375ICK5_9BURK|nr:hypothetical protein [Cupriavidus taiwanensis]SOY42745.1 putative transmembrane lipoprotein [Cupriavidus taiwanensis]SOY58841.1 putative transmembrane lipoprotein [Cupriavidus taiwanensis]SOY80076.1 putative transmembrane lipoprotein [Cupriavidus taiwanensis]SOZ26626.1 putative transmembrane lipoprotein [Cupriavidus taiwanensis]SOZ50814.1 putative transmembrane lipoprotein [Cupriavidus taiwanensis]
MKVNRTRHGQPQHGIAGACLALALCMPGGTALAQSAGMANLLKRYPSTQASDPGNSQREARARAERHRTEQREAERRRGEERGGSRLSPDERRRLRKNLYDFGRDIYQGG